MAPTTPTAYRSANPDMSLTASTRPTGMTVATITPKPGTPNRLSCLKTGGISPSRDMRNWIVIRSPMAVLTAESSRKPNTPATIQPNTLPTAGPSTPPTNTCPMYLSM